MMDNMSVKEALEWYVGAGVIETFGREVFCMAENLPKPVAPVTEGARKATTSLAQDALGAVKTARDICDSIHSLEKLHEKVEAFDGCALKLTASKTVFGDGNQKSGLMIIGEAPGADEDRVGLPFVGRSGHLLDKMLKAIGVKDRTGYYISNILPWRPPGNRSPTDAEVAVCLPFLKKQIELINPEIILILGGSAANSLLNNGESISKLRGKWLSYKKADGKEVNVLASFHPAYLLRNSAQKAKAWSDFVRLKKKIDGK